MSALDQMRASLDQLMGTSRDGEDSKYKVRFDDPRVCKSFLLGCCPHEILSSTRMDLGECPKVHDLALKADYEMACANKDYYYDIDAMEHLQNFIGDCDKRTEIAKRKLKETQEELSEEATAKAERIHELGEKMGTTLAKAEEVGAEGNVEESLKLMKEVEDLKKEKAQAELEYRNSMPASSYQQQKLRVCEVCSAYLGIHDNDRRLADHFGGKLHLGFITIRDKLSELQVKVEKNATERRLQREAEREVRRLEREKEDAERREKEREREEERETSGSKSERRSRSKSHSRKRSRSQSRRSRSRDKKRRSRSRSRNHRRRSRSRSRNSRRRRSHSRTRRSRSRSKRSRSRDRRRRSRSRDRSSRSKRSSSRSKRSKRSGSRERSSRPKDDKPQDDKSAEKQPEAVTEGEPKNENGVSEHIVAASGDNGTVSEVTAPPQVTVPQVAVPAEM